MSTKPRKAQQQQASQPQPPTPVIQCSPQAPIHMSVIPPPPPGLPPLQSTQIEILQNPNVKDNLEENIWHMFQSRRLLCFALCEYCLKKIWYHSDSAFIQQLNPNVNNVVFQLCDECIEGNIAMGHTHCFHFKKNY